ncbi:ABC transporter ATP-binding protein [Microbacterium sp. NPDC056234]|uniref:ABC transporter ATP-binding protein n=1 Tax=Microbacterium sp. NPDC056234 TaxID=3345757 RepID=UPI0035DFD70E
MRVRFDGVTVALGGRDVVHEASLTAESGAVVGLLGPNGSGKSTLLRTLYRAVRPRTGSVHLGDVDIAGMTGREAARAVAVMLQDPHTDFDLTVHELVLLGRSPHRRALGRESSHDLEVVDQAMQSVGVDDLADRMIGTLSGGQRQRVMLARALAQQTPVIVLDEPSNHLDIRHQIDLMTIIRGLDRTVIAALHDLNLALQYCDGVVVLVDGRVLAAGPPAEVLTPELIRTAFDVDARLLTDTDDRVLSFRAPSALTTPRESRLHT